MTAGQHRAARALAVVATALATIATLRRDFLIFAPIVALVLYPILIRIAMRVTGKPTADDFRNESTALQWQIVIFCGAVGAILILIVLSNPDGRGIPTEREVRNVMLVGGSAGAVVIGIPAMFVWRSFARIFFAPVAATTGGQPKP